jgi:hypothetical protein
VSTAATTVPALLSLPNSQSASRAYDVTLSRLQILNTTLSTLAVAVYTTTLVLTTKRHPYLMYSGGLAGVAGIWGLRRKLGRTTVEDDFEYLDKENAEVIRERILGLRDWIGIGCAGVGFIVSVVGGYGEGFNG